jgi:acyl-[acyl-carrier-protein] desaturase
MTVPRCPSFAEVEAPPRAAPPVLSREAKHRILERGFRGLYRWYVNRSQSARNWSPDRSFDWPAFRRDHSAPLLTVLQGFYAVEQYAPDYTAELTRLTRGSHGRSHFQMRWGAEEEKHADLWRNALLFSGQRQPDWIEDYTAELRRHAWKPHWDDPLRMLIYTVFQERATQVNYLNTAAIARGTSGKPEFANDADPVLARAAATIAADEAAHYDFFLEGTRMYLYYFPEETLAALVDVLRRFAMPAMDIIPNYDAFVSVLYDAGIYGKRQFARDVVRPALAHLGIANVRRIEAGIQRSRQAPAEDGRAPEPSVGCPQDGVNFPVLESTIRHLFARIGSYETSTGLDRVDPTRLVLNSWNEL